MELDPNSASSSSPDVVAPTEDAQQPAASNNLGFLENLKQLFDECDVDKNGSLGPEEFSDLCAKIGLNKDAAEETFRRLDIDSNQRVTFDEFAAGFNQYRKKAASGPPVHHATNSSRASPQTMPSGKSPSLGTRGTQSGGPPPRLSPVVSRSSGRKSASPLGVVSLGSSNSTGNLLASRSTTTSTGIESCDFNSVDGGGYNYSYGGGINGVRGNTNNTDSGKDSMIVYGCDAIADYEQPGNSGQFGSLMSNQSGSLSQLRNMQDLLDCVQKLQSENQILSQIFFKDKREREEYISQLGEEFDQQVREVEERANKRAREELEAEKRRLREMMQDERETLQHHYQTIEKMSNLIKSSNGRIDADGESIDKVRSKLEDTFLENRQLKKSLLDTKTDVALIWKEMEKLKSQYEDKLTTAYERHNETKSECDHIKQQLNLMKDSNRKLQDASDILTNYITDKVEPVIKSVDASSNGYSVDDSNLLGGDNTAAHFRLTGLGSQSNSRKGSILSEYLIEDNDEHPNSIDCHDRSTNGDVESFNDSHRDEIHLERLGYGPLKPLNSLESNQSRELLSQVSIAIKPPPPPQAISNQNCPNDRMSQVSNRLEVQEAPPIAPRKSSDKSISQREESSSGLSTIIKESSRSINSGKSADKSRIFNLFDKAGGVKQAEGPKTLLSKEGNDNKSCDKSSQPLQVLDSDLDDQEPIVEPADGPGSVTFNIILVGDSFVGKSSFAARLMEGEFVQGLISNCSIDFKTKVYKVDGTNYTINLWDTAGQERFRSITASYFRKAEGIILMYDITEKRTYLNVRNWMSTIADTAPENVAVLLIGNKSDLRQKQNETSCVPYEEGARLAKEYGIFFLETSVKTGKNLSPSMGQLIRLIAKNNRPEEEDEDLIRLNDKSKTFNCMPKNC